MGRRATLEFTVGRLVCAPVRRYLLKRQFFGADIEFQESSGWLTREFIVKGDYDTMQSVVGDLKEWANEDREDAP